MKDKNPILVWKKKDFGNTAAWWHPGVKYGRGGQSRHNISPADIKKWRGGITISAGNTEPVAALLHEMGHWKMGHMGVPSDNTRYHESGEWYEKERDAYKKALRLARSEEAEELLRRDAYLRMPSAVEPITDPHVRHRAASEIEELFGEKNPAGRDRLNSKEHKVIRRLMKHMKVPKLKVTIEPESSRDIAVYLSDDPKHVPHIIAGKRWLAAHHHERCKRMLHELAHIAGKRHDGKSRQAGYYSNPEKDQYTRDLYYWLTGVKL
ncbi:MAG: hypothetical protein Q8O55_01190 [Dehalococcoidales bacterium]|nr:hypothetical protein [Dehalococcoidales bacterium]